MTLGHAGDVGIYVPTNSCACRVVVGRQHVAFGLPEDAYEVGDPLLVALSGQQRHDHQLDAQEHEQVAPFGLDAEHGDGSASSQQQDSGGGTVSLAGPGSVVLLGTINAFPSTKISEVFDH